MRYAFPLFILMYIELKHLLFVIIFYQIESFVIRSNNDDHASPWVKKVFFSLFFYNNPI